KNYTKYHLPRLERKLDLYRQARDLDADLPKLTEGSKLDLQLLIIYAQVDVGHAYTDAKDAVNATLNYKQSLQQLRAIPASFRAGMPVSARKDLSDLEMNLESAVGKDK